MSNLESNGSAKGLVERMFPGDRRVWVISGVILAVALILIAIALLKPRQDLLGTNSVGARTATAIVPPNTELCVPDLRVPAGTGQVEFILDTRQEPRPQMAVTIRESSGRIIRGISPASSLGGHHPYAITIPTQPAHPESVLAEVCLTAKAQVFAWGTAAPEAIPAPTIGGVATPFHVSVLFLGPPGAQRSIISQMGEMFRRAALFNAGFVGAWTYWALLLLVFPMLAYGAIRLIATADLDRRRRVPFPLLVGVITFGVAASWAIMTPAFQSPDESEHFAYVQHFAETGQAVETVQTKRPPYSESEALALNAVYHTSVIERPDTRPPWLTIEAQAYRKEFKAFDNQHDRSDGGGYHPAISPHTPAYYALLAPAYLLTRHDSIFTQLFATRLTSAIMGALIAILATLTVLELLPGRRALAAAGGLLIAFEPMFTYTAGAINNDNGVNLAAALLIYLIVRTMRRGLDVTLGLAIGATMVAAPILKGTGYELYPPAILALALAMVRNHGRRNWLALATLATTIFVLQTGWSELAHVVHRSTFTTPAGTTPGTTLEAFHKPKTYLSWMIRFVSPFKPAFINHNWTVFRWPFFNVYIERGFASFGWYAIYFPKWVYYTIVVAFVSAALLAGRVLWHESGVLRRHWPEMLVLALVPIAVIGAVEANFEPSLTAIPLEGIPEEGRYAFPSIVAVAVLFIGASYGVGRRRAIVLASGAVACLIGLTLASQLLTLSAFFT